ncbi:Uncharacterised protein [Mycobacteroides abscessus subsp. abscessus]|nr:Uncharacterised protein [Mycobacteroides abscessus subsp. abscessus]
MIALATVARNGPHSDCAVSVEEDRTGQFMVQHSQIGPLGEYGVQIVHRRRRSQVGFGGVPDVEETGPLTRLGEVGVVVPACSRRQIESRASSVDDVGDVRIAVGFCDRRNGRDELVEVTAERVGIPAVGPQRDPLVHVRAQRSPRDHRVGRRATSEDVHARLPDSGVAALLRHAPVILVVLTLEHLRPASNRPGAGFVLVTRTGLEDRDRHRGILTEAGRYDAACGAASHDEIVSDTGYIGGTGCIRGTGVVRLAHAAGSDARFALANASLLRVVIRT